MKVDNNKGLQDGQAFVDIIKLDGVEYAYPADNALNALDGVSFCVRKGEYVALVGHNGSGKSTIAKLLNGLLIADKGSVNVCGIELNSNSAESDVFEVRKNVGMVFQNPDNQMVASIVEDDVAFGPENLGIKREEIIKRVEFALNSVGMYDYRSRTPNRLSGGQKQRIAIAGVLALSPEILVLDEFTAMLDPKGRDEVLAVVGRLNKESGKTVIHITHFMEETLCADRVIILKSGKVALIGTPCEVFERGDIIADCGLEVPRVLHLAKKLKEAGYALEGGLYTASQLGEELCGLL